MFIATIIIALIYLFLNIRLFIELSENKNKKRSNNGTEQAIKNIENEGQEAIYKFKNEIEKNILNAIDLKYDINLMEFTVKPVLFKTKSCTLSVELPPVERCFKIPIFESFRYNNGALSIEIIDTLVNEFGCFIAFNISCTGADCIKLDFIDKDDKTKSKVFLLDTKNNKYYFPIAENFPSIISNNNSAIGIIAFEPFRKTPGDCHIHFIEIDLGNNRKSPLFKLILNSNFKEGLIEEQLRKPSVFDGLKEQLKDNAN